MNLEQNKDNKTYYPEFSKDKNTYLVKKGNNVITDFPNEDEAIQHSKKLNKMMSVYRKMSSIEKANKESNTMNLEQIVKETVAKIVAEKELTAAEEKKREEIVKAMKKDFKGPAPAMYAIATDKAKKLAEDGDHEVSMAQNSLDSIIRSAMELKAKIGDQEINIPAWIQDHITNSENFIDQASQGYHEYENGDEAGESEEMNEEYDFAKSAIESASGDKISYTEEDDYGRIIYWSSKNPNINYFLGQGGEFEGKIYLYNGETGERYPIGDLKHYGDGQNHSADDDMHESQDISDDELAQLQATADDTSKMPAERDAARNKIYASRAKKESQELDEWTINRWQHYAGIK